MKMSRSVVGRLSFDLPMHYSSLNFIAAGSKGKNF